MRNDKGGILNKTLAFVDIETTGLNILKHEIIEIGVVIAKHNDTGELVIKEEIEMKVQPQRIDDADPEALRVNGYDPAQWMFGVTLEQAMQKLSERTEGAVMVAQNVSFDYSFLTKAFAETGIESKMFYANLDTISLAVAKLAGNPSVKRYTLRALCDYFGIRNERAHTALSDARATFEVYKKLMRL
jgi:DNA polymerase-3 subunit epsilon